MAWPKLFQRRKPKIDKLTQLKNRQAVLDQVKRTWIENYLEASLYGASLIDLGMTKDQAKLVDNPWHMELRKVKEQTAQLLHQGTKITDVFAQEGRSLLILGEPGSGKTTMLLSLARDMIAEAELGASKPIPMVFNLSSWGQKQPAFTDWLLDELERKYCVPIHQGHAWIEQNNLLLLLDGLDEVSSEKREACVAAINNFYQKNRLTNQMVVCSRVDEYTTLTTRLQLEAAVILQPLQLKQIETYFSTLSIAAVKSQLQDALTTEQMDAPASPTKNKNTLFSHRVPPSQKIQERRRKRVSDLTPLRPCTFAPLFSLSESSGYVILSSFIFGVGE